MTQPSLACPRCGLLDQVQKVSAVVVAGAYTNVTEGRTTGTGTGTYYGTRALATEYNQTSVVTKTHQTVLGQRLEPPAPPQIHNPILMGLVAAGVAFLGLGVVGAAYSNLPMEFTWEWYLSFIGSSILGALCFVGAVMAGTAWLDTNRRSRADFARQHHRWQQAMHKWEQLYTALVTTESSSPASPNSYQRHT